MCVENYWHAEDHHFCLKKCGIKCNAKWNAKEKNWKSRLKKCTHYSRNGKSRKKVLIYVYRFLHYFLINSLGRM